MRKYLAIVAIILTLLIVISLQPKEENFKIGAILHLTGDQSEPAGAFRDGIILAADEINSQGGINGKHVQVIIEDDALKSANAYTSAQKLINIDKIGAGIDASFLEIASNNHLFEQAKIPVIVLWDSNPRIDAMGEYTFSIGPWTPSAGEAAADFAYNELDARNVVVINNMNEWSKDVSSFFRARFENLGGAVLDEFSVDPSDSNDYRTIISKSTDKKPDVIYSPITDGVSVFYIQLKELGFNKPVITSDIITENIIESTKGATEGIYQTQMLQPESERTRIMKELYRKKFGKEPKHTLFTSWGYDAVHIIAEAAKNAKSGKEIKNNLYKIKDFNGASQMITINENGSSPMFESIFQVRNGSFVLVK